MTETGGQPPVSFPTKDVAVLLFLLRRLTRRGRNAACGQCPVSGRARDGRFYRSWLTGLVMTVLTVGLVSCAGKSLPRFWPGDFFPTFYACHLAVLGVLAL